MVSYVHLIWTPIISDLHLGEKFLNIQESRYLETSPINSSIQIRSKYKANISKDTFFLASSWQFQGVGNQWNWNNRIWGCLSLFLFLIFPICFFSPRKWILLFPTFSLNVVGGDRGRQLLIPIRISYCVRVAFKHSKKLSSQIYFLCFCDKFSCTTW